MAAQGSKIGRQEAQGAVKVLTVDSPPKLYRTGLNKLRAQRTAFNFSSSALFGRLLIKGFMAVWSPRKEGP
eukprot:407314-Pyramimonas_sp.AAC.1